MFANSRPSASNFKSLSRSLEQFSLTVGQNNFGYKIPSEHRISKEDEKMTIDHLPYTNDDMIPRLYAYHNFSLEALN